jgi:hypothetical protein
MIFPAAWFLLIFGTLARPLLEPADDALGLSIDFKGLESLLGFTNPAIPTLRRHTFEKRSVSKHIIYSLLPDLTFP